MTAQLLADTQADASGEGSGLFLILMLGLLAVFMVFTFMRGKKMRDAQANAMSSAVTGAQVVTAGGMIGTVVARDEELQRVTLEFSSGDRADFTLSSVIQILEPAPGVGGAEGEGTGESRTEG